MTINDLIATLETIRNDHGNINVSIEFDCNGEYEGIRGQSENRGMWLDDLYPQLRELPRE